jgi:putative ABC transport system permease protein
MIAISSTIKISLRALWVNKMRSSLTMLGIIIGVGAVITMLAIGNGARQKLAKEVASVGSNLIIVVPGSMTQSGVRMGSGSQSTLTMADAEAIGRECSAVQAVAPAVNRSSAIIYGNANWTTAVTGTTADMLTVRDCRIVSGRNFNDQDLRNATKVCLLGQTVVDNLFGNEDPVGKIVRVKNVPFMVVGVMEAKGQGPMGQDQDDIVYIPCQPPRNGSSAPPFPAW